MLYKYPYTNLYNLNLDWLIQAVKELQEIVEPLENVVTSVNGMTGDVTITREILTQILGGMVSKFNGRDGDVELTAEDVNSTLIDITWTSDPGDVIGDLTQTQLDEMYTSGKRVLIFVNNLGVANQVYFLQYYDSHAQPQEYSPTSALAGVASFNGLTGNVTATGADLATSATDQTTIAANLANLENTKVPNTRTVNNQPLSANVSINAANVPSQAITGATDVEMALGNLNASKVPNARQVNGKSLLTDITLNDEDIPSDVDGKTNVAEVLSYHSQQIGDVALPTTAQTLTGAIAENHNQIDAIEEITYFTDAVTQLVQWQWLTCVKKGKLCIITGRTLNINAQDTSLLMVPEAYRPPYRVISNTVGMNSSGSEIQSYGMVIFEDGYVKIKCNGVGNYYSLELVYTL